LPIPRGPTAGSRIQGAAPATGSLGSPLPFLAEPSSLSRLPRRSSGLARPPDPQFPESMGGAEPGDGLGRTEQRRYPSPRVGRSELTQGESSPTCSNVLRKKHIEENGLRGV